MREICLGINIINSRKQPKPRLGSHLQNCEVPSLGQDRNRPSYLSVKTEQHLGGGPCVQFCLEPVTEKECIWTVHFLNAPSQAVISGDTGALGLSLAPQQAGLVGALLGTACVHEEGRPYRTMTQGHRSKSAPKQLTNPGKGEGSRRGCEGRQAGARLKRRKGEDGLTNPVYHQSKVKTFGAKSLIL